MNYSFEPGIIEIKTNDNGFNNHSFLVEERREKYVIHVISDNYNISAMKEYGLEKNDVVSRGLVKSDETSVYSRELFRLNKLGNGFSDAFGKELIAILKIAYNACEIDNSPNRINHKEKIWN